MKERSIFPRKEVAVMCTCPEDAISTTCTFFPSAKSISLKSDSRSVASFECSVLVDEFLYSTPHPSNELSVVDRNCTDRFSRYRSDEQIQ